MQLECPHRGEGFGIGKPLLQSTLTAFQVSVQDVICKFLVLLGFMQYYYTHILLSFLTLIFYSHSESNQQFSIILWIYQSVGFYIKFMRIFATSWIIILSILMISTSPTLYSVSTNFTISYEKSYDELAHATYQQYMYEKGWNYLRIYANSRVGLTEQHRGAGFLQGYITYRDIYSAYQNLLSSSVMKSKLLSVSAQGYIDQQLQYIQTMVQNHPRDLYWQYAGAYIQQLRYMYRGYLTRINVEKTVNLMYLGFSQFYYLTNEGDLQDLIPAFQYLDEPNKEIIQQQSNKPGNCNGYVKLLDSKLYIGHSTHNIYQFLLRIYKTYSFPSRDSNIGSQWIAFSSRPGDMTSKDDFYVLSNGLVVMQTSLANMKKQNYKELSPKSVPNWLRSLIAVNLAKNGNQWANYYLRQNSGTHNNQWLVIDPSKLTTFKEVVLFVQQGFSDFDVFDMTPTLQSKGYVGSYNIPYSQKIHKKLGYENYPYTIDNEPRAAQFKRYDKFISNTETMKKWLIDNDLEDVTTGLAPRYDLAPKPSAFGLTDCKIYTPQTAKNNYIWAISGPSTSNGRFPPFDWSNWPKISHVGLPRVWNFTWQKYTIIDPESISNFEAEKDQISQIL